MSRVACFDTGKITGIATYHPHWQDSFNAWSAPEDDAMDWFLLNFQSFDVIVYEQITITAQTAKKSQDILAAIRQIGVLVHACRRVEKATVRQKPVEVMNFAPDALLKTLDWYTPGPDHARDATRHLVHYLAASDMSFRKRLVR